MTAGPMLRGALRFCGSVKLAMLLLGVVIAAAITGTLVESGFDTAVAQAYIYDAPWFIAWLLLLCVNLIGAVAVRYPWKAHQTGFVITHAGIVIILIGGVIGRIWGIEGHMTLAAGGGSQDFLVVDQTLLQVQTSGSPEPTSFVVDLKLRSPSLRRPLVFDKGGVRIAVVDMAKELGAKTVVEPGGSNGVAAVRLVMSSGMAPHPIEHWLVLGDARRDRASLGPNTIHFASHEPNSVTVSQGQSQAAASRETHFAFSKVAGMNMARLQSGTASGAAVRYDFTPGGLDEDRGILHLELDGQTVEISVREAQAGVVALAGTEWTLAGLRYFADFRMEGKTPASASINPNNPAIVFDLIGPAKMEAAPKAEEKACCAEHAQSPPGEKSAHFHGTETVASGATHYSSDTAHGGPARGGNRLTIFHRDGELHFVAETAAGESGGRIEPGVDFIPGWADWKLRVEEFIGNAVVREEIGPMREDGMRSLETSGLLVQITRGGETIERWLQMGATTFAAVGGEHLHLGFGNRLHPLGFHVALERFEVEFNEGTATPAGFKSHVRFIDPGTGAAQGRKIWMNHPANFPSFAGASLLGTSYKFSQSSWNPGDLEQSTFQVIRDPGWLFKWTGSLVFCLGLVTIFYIKPYPRKAKPPESGSRIAQEIPEPLSEIRA